MAIDLDYLEFESTLNASQPDPQWSEALQAMWYDAKGNWEEAHNIAQDMHNSLGSWMHAYLHRKEGDAWNAGYWYRQASKPFPNISLEQEHRQITEYILNQ